MLWSRVVFRFLLACCFSISQTLLSSSWSGTACHHILIQIRGPKRKKRAEESLPISFEGVARSCMPNLFVHLHCPAPRQLAPPERRETKGCCFYSGWPWARIRVRYNRREEECKLAEIPAVSATPTLTIPGVLSAPLPDCQPLGTVAYFFSPLPTGVWHVK